MNRQTLSVFSLFLVGVFSFVGVVGSGEIQTITLHGKPLTLIGKIRRWEKDYRLCVFLALE